MGGEQEAVLFYGPKELYDNLSLLKLFKIVNFDDDEEESDDDNTELFDFLTENDLDTGYPNNCDWSECYIGTLVNDYEGFINNETEKMNNVKAFCEKYDLPKPTFFAVIIGEYE
jgi:hypothetical protein